MSAKKMFEKLDYEYFKRSDFKSYIKYTKGDTSITFDLTTKEIKIWATKLQQHLLSFNTEEIKAIQQQILELGWEE